jgi:hypothetical protein
MKRTLLILALIISSQMLLAQVVHNVCAGSAVVLHLSVPTSGGLQWQQSPDNITYNNIAGATSDTLSIAAAQASLYYRIRITGTNCNPYFSEVRRVNLLPLPVVSISGLSSSYCQTAGPVQLSGIPAGGVFVSTVMTGASFHPGTAGLGSHLITYVYTDSNGCINQASQTTQVMPPPSAANAGSNITSTALSVQLSGNAPAVGTGQWTIASGSGGTFANAGNPLTNFTGTTNSVYTLVWTISNPPCEPSADTVVVTMPTGTILPSVACGGNTLYVHPTDNAGPTSWGCIGIVAGAGDDNNGALNTTTIVGACGTSTAAYICDNLVAFGYSDWYLPSYNELDCVRSAAASIGGFSAGTYWSSTEGTGIWTANARYRTFPSGTSGYGSKSNTHRIRCVRKD